MKLIKNITGNTLFRLSSLNSVSILVRVAGGLLASKMIALFIGPAGMALTGNLRNFLTLVDSVSTLGLQNGIIKYTAEHEKDRQKLNSTLATISIAVLAAILFISMVLFMLAGYISNWVFTSEQDYAWIFRVLALALPLYTANLVFMAVLNGLGNYKQVIWLNIWGNIIGVLLSAVLIWQLHISGALLGLILYPALLFFFSVYYMHKRFPGFTFFRRSYFDVVLLRNLLSYSLMSLVTVVLSTVIFIAIRNQLSNSYSAAEAGYWEAINRLSSFYLMFATTMLSLYFLPKLSVAGTNADTRNVFFSYFKIMLPAFATGLLIIFILKAFIIKLLFSVSFLPMEKLFLWQLAGDFFKVASLILGYEFFAKKLTKAYIVTEIISFCVLYISSHFFIQQYGSEGAVMAHALTYYVYFIMLAVYFKKKIFK